MPPIRATIWNEFVHEKTKPEVGRIYPEGLHRVIAAGLTGRLRAGVEVRSATLDEPEHGLTPAALAATDVLFWWGHGHHDRVADAVVERVQRRVWEGMGLVVLHSGAHVENLPPAGSMEQAARCAWRDAGERVTGVGRRFPSHPIAAGLQGEYFEIPQSEMYGEYFDIPAPEELIFVSWFAGGEVFRSGCTFHRGKGKIFYFSPGHETFPIYHDANVQRVLANATLWAAPSGSAYHGEGREIAKPIETIGRPKG